MARRWSWLAATLTVAAMAASAFPQARTIDEMQAAENGPGGGSALPLTQQETVARANQQAVVVVEYQVQYDKGDAPRMGSYGNLEEYVTDDMPLERPGFLVDAKHVVTADLQIQSRFIKSIKVRAYGADPKTGARVGAGVSAYPKKQNALILELDGALAGSKPAVFDSKRSEPYMVLDVLPRDTRWGIRVLGMAQQMTILPDKSFMESPRGLVVDKAGGPVGMVTGVELPVHGEWKGSPMEWPAYSAAEMKELLAKVEARTVKGIVPVTLNFRSPSSNTALDRYSRRGEVPTVQHALGVVTGEKTVLVLGEMKTGGHGTPGARAHSDAASRGRGLQSVVVGFRRVRRGD